MRGSFGFRNVRWGGGDRGRAPSAMGTGVQTRFPAACVWLELPPAANKLFFRDYFFAFTLLPLLGDSRVLEKLETVLFVFFRCVLK